MTDYVAIIVHKDVLEIARRIVKRIEDEDERHSLQDLVDPLPEADINGVTPRIIEDFQARRLRCAFCGDPMYGAIRIHHHAEDGRDVT